MQKRKRKYTVTEKVLAANRRNLMLAREVDPEIRYRPTEKRLRACRSNLRRALAILRSASLRRDGRRRPGPRPRLCVERGWVDSPSYGTGFTRGLCAISLRRSARLAGETSEAYDNHVAMFLRALRPSNPREQRLARGIAETVWRRLRVHRGQERWERAHLLYRLREAAAGPAPGWELDEDLTPVELAARLAESITDILNSDSCINDAAEKLNMRLERLARLWVVGRGGDP